MSSAAAGPQFDAAARQELAEFAQQEQSRFKMQQSVQELTDTCWKKCITGSIGGKFSRGEASCLENCADRFLDTSLFIVNKIQQQGGQQH